jgi:hypothetical protein
MAPKIVRLTDLDAKPTFWGIHHDPKAATSGYIEHLIEASVCTDAIASAPISSCYQSQLLVLRTFGLHQR